MAVSENIDIGSLIAGAIDRFYEQLDGERVCREQKSAESRAFVESLYQRYLKLRDAGLLDEAQRRRGDDDYGSSGGVDDEGGSTGGSIGAFGDDEDAAQEAALAAWQKQQAGQPKPKQPKAQSGDAPAERPQQPRRRLAKSTTYRQGYQTGWKAAHSGAPANPPAQHQGDQEYVQGYMDGHKVSGHVKKVIGHYNDALNHHNVAFAGKAGRGQQRDHAPADESARLAGEAAQPIVDHHFNDWISKSHALMGHEGEALFRENIARVSDRTKRRWKTPEGANESVPLAGMRSPLVGAIHHVGSKINAAMQQNHPDPDNYVDHPASFAGQIGKMIHAFANKENIPDKKDAAGQGGEAKGGGSGYAGPERQVAAVDPGEEAAQARLQHIQDEGDKEELARNAWHPEEHAAHVARHGVHPLAHHPTVESAKEAAVDHWKSRLIKHVADNMGPGRKHDVANAKPITVVNADGSTKSMDFDVGKALLAVINHPKGAFSSSARADAIRAQWPVKEGEQIHPKAFSNAQGRMERAEKDLAGQHEHFDRKGPMFKLASGGRETGGGAKSWAARRQAQAGQAPAEQAVEQAVEQMLDMFENWLIENAELDEERRESIMEELCAETYYRRNYLGEA
jgi:hypothetical protein